MIDRRRRLLILGTSAAALATALGLRLRARRGANASASASTGAPATATDAAAHLMAPQRLGGPLTLDATPVTTPLFAGAPTRILAYRDPATGALNPTLSIARGATLDVTLRNGLDEDTTLHWHGLLVDEANDGSGLHPVPPGATRRYRFDVRNRAGLYWYHAHPHMKTGRQLQLGLAGLLKVEDDEDRALSETLGLDASRDIALMLSDRQIDAHNAIVYRDQADDWIGNRVFANWRPEAVREVAPALHRFRIANVSNARLLRPAFLHEDTPLPMQLIGTDGGLLAQAWPMDDLFLGPAQRADVLVDFSALPPGSRVVLRSLDYVAMENDDDGGIAPDAMGEHPGAAKNGEPLDLMLLQVVAPRTTTTTATAAIDRLPSTLSSLPDAPTPADVADWPVRPIRLSMDANGSWFINGLNFHTCKAGPAFEVRRGSREVWEIRNNMSSMPHPMHVHGTQFRVLSRSISPPDIRARSVDAQGRGPQDLGLCDTVVVWPGETVRLAMHFDAGAAGTQRYMLHCHNLEHEDMGMMLTFAVVEPTHGATT